MRALTIRQPWAGAIIWLGKRVENRSWRTRYRGPVLIHAASQPDTSAPVELFAALEHVTHGPEEYGAFIGTADLVAVVDDDPSLWFTGPHGFVLENVRPIEPQPAKGKLGLWSPDDEGYDIDDMALSRVDGG